MEIEKEENKKVAGEGKWKKASTNGGKVNKVLIGMLVIGILLLILVLFGITIEIFYPTMPIVQMNV